MKVYIVNWIYTCKLK